LYIPFYKYIVSSKKMETIYVITKEPNPNDNMATVSIGPDDCDTDVGPSKMSTIVSNVIGRVEVACIVG